MKKLSLSISLCALLLGVSPILTAQDEPKPSVPPPPGPRPLAEEAWKKMDADGDGKVSKEEFATHAKGEAEKRFDAVDGNKDGVIEKEEFEEAAKRLRERQDRRPQGEGERGERGGFRRPGPPDGERGPGGERGPRPDGEGRRGGGEFFKRLDANGDGYVSKDEFVANAGERFDDLDKEKKGKLSEEDFQNMGRRLMGGGREGGPPAGPGPGGRPPEAN